MECETEGGDQHRADLHELSADGYAALAVAVGEEASAHAEQDEGQREEQHDHGDESVAAFFRETGADDDSEQKVTQYVVAEGTLELSGDEGPEATGLSDWW